MRSPLIGSELTLAFPPAFTIASPSTDRGEAMVKVGGRTLLSSRSRATFTDLAPTDSAEDPKKNDACFGTSHNALRVDGNLPSPEGRICA